MSLCVLVKRFPKLSETFVEGEIASLIAEGFELQIASLYRPSDELLHSSSVRFIGRLTYVDRGGLATGLCLAVIGVIRGGRSALQVLWDLRAGGRTVIGQVFRLLAFCRRHRIRHIHAHTCSEPALLAEAVSMLGGPSFSFTAHAKDLYLCCRTTLNRLVGRARFVTTCTRHNLAYLESVSVNQNIHVVYHGIDTAKFAPFASSLQSEPNEVPVIVAVGRLKEKKGFDLLIRACESLRDHGVRFVLRIYGYGDQREELERQIRSAELCNQAAICQPVTHDELPDLLRRADLFVLPCRVLENGDRDGIPNALLEAMASGLPSIATSVSGIVEVVQPGLNGLLVASENLDALVEAMAQLLADGKLCEQIGARARSTVVQQFSWARNIREFAKLLSAALEEEQTSVMEGAR